MASGPKYTDALLVDWARRWVKQYDDNPDGLQYPIQTMAEGLRLLVKLADAERIRKGRPALPAQRPRSDLGKMVEAKRTQGLNTTEAREAVAKEMGILIKRVAQAHRRWLVRAKPLVRRRK